VNADTGAPARPDSARGGPATRGIARWAPVALGAILILALGLRVWRLDEHALWWDEGNNAYFAHATPAQLVEMARLTNDTNPPVHRLALGLWLRLLGDSARNLRLLSALCGTASVALAYAWGLRLGGVSAGLLAALLLALSPTAIYYSREAKGYPWVTLFAWLALTALVAADGLPCSASRRRRLALWCGYVLASTLAVGAHYYALFVHLAQGVWLLGAVGRRWPGWRPAVRRLLPWTLAQLAVAALVAPWLWLTWRTAYAGAEAIPLERGALAAGRYLAGMITRLAAGPAPQPAWAWAAGMTLLFLAGAGLGAPRERGGDGAGAWLVAAVALVPVGAGYLAQRLAVIVIPRLLLYVVPALCILAGVGLARWRGRWQWVTLAATLVLALGWGMNLPRAYAAPAPPEEDFRELAAGLDALARPGDVLVVNYIWQEGMLRMYAPRLPVSWRLGWYTEASVAEAMQALSREYERIWLMSYRQPLQHPSNLAGWWLENEAVRALAWERGHTRLALYLPACAPLEAPIEHLFQGGMALRQAPLVHSASAGDVLTLTLAWRAAPETPPLPEDLTVFLQLLGPDGALVAQADGDAANGLAPLAATALGETLNDCRALTLPAGILPGTYTVIAGLYSRTTGARLPTAQGADHATLGTIQVRAQ